MLGRVLHTNVQRSFQVPVKMLALESCQPRYLRLTGMLSRHVRSARKESVSLMGRVIASAPMPDVRGENAKSRC